MSDNVFRVPSPGEIDEQGDVMMRLADELRDTVLPFVVRIRELLEEALPAEPAPVTGTYLYEGGGFFGDFTLTLTEDGRYTFYEGPLSSYIGGGRWFTSGSFLYLSEDQGLTLFNTLIPVRDALIFQAEDSDNFVYVKVPDGGRFLRAPEAVSADGEPGERIVGAGVPPAKMTLGL